MSRILRLSKIIKLHVSTKQTQVLGEWRERKKNLSPKQKMPAMDNQTILLLCLSFTSNKIVAGLYNERILKQVNFNYRRQSGIESKV